MFLSPQYFDTVDPPVCQSNLSNNNSPTVKYLNIALDLPQKPFSPYILALLWLLRAIKARQNAEISTLVLPYPSTAYNVSLFNAYFSWNCNLKIFLLKDNLIPCDISSFRNLDITSVFINWSPCIFLLNFNIYIYFKHKHNTDLSTYFFSIYYIFVFCGSFPPTRCMSLK